MLLRWLVNNYLRDAAEQTIRQTFAERVSSDGAVTSGPSDSAVGKENDGCDLAILFALGMEAAPLVDALKDAASTKRGATVEHAGTLLNRLTVIAESGIGQKLAGEAARDVIVGYEPKWLISAGFAGSL